MLGEIIAEGTDVVASFFIDIVRQEGLGEEEGYVHDGFGPLMPVQEGGYDYHGFSDPMQVQEGDRDDGSGDRTESGQVYILVKPMLTSRLMHSLFWYLHILTLVFLLISSPPDRAQLW